MKKVSIIIPTYNQSKLVKRAVKSALSQTYSNIEVIVSDDNSTDDTENALNIFLNNNNFFYFKNKTNIGRVANYRKAMSELASGDFCLCLDGDDFLIDKNYIRDAISLINKNKLVIVFAKQRVFFQKYKKIINDRMNDKLPNIIDGKWLFLNYYRGYSIPHLSTLYDRKLAIEVGYYTQDILSSDWESVLKLMLKGRVGYINRSVGVWRKHDYNESKTENLKKIFDNTIYIVSSGDYAKNNNYFPVRIIEKWKILMLKRYYIKLLVKFSLTKNDTAYKATNIFFKHQYPKVFYLTLFDLRVAILLILVKNNKIAKFIFKKIFKIESFLEDIT